MSNPAEKFLTAPERLQIEARVAEAEKRTSGEIVVMVVPASYHYPLASMLGSLLLAMLIAIVATFYVEFAARAYVEKAVGMEIIWFFPALFSLLFMLLNEVVKRTPSLKRCFVTPSDMKEEVEEAAIQSFYYRDLNQTVDHTGILIYISLFEHKVRVIADKGINDKVSQDVWQEVVTIIVGGIRAKAQAGAIATAVDRCAEILSRYFPLKPGDRNELSNEVIIGRGK